MSEQTRRIIYAILITGSVIATPVVGVFGPFANGNGAALPSREYFLPAGFVFATVWSINYLGLALFGLWQALPSQCENRRVRAALPWIAATALGNVAWIALAGSLETSPWTVPVLLFMEFTAWGAYLRWGLHQTRSLPRTEWLLGIALRVYVGWLSVATIANTAAALNVLRWDGFGISPVTWTLIMLVAATLVAALIGRLVNEDNVYRCVFVYAFVGIVVEQGDVPAIVWTASAAAATVAAIIVLSRIQGAPVGAEMA